MYSKAVLTSLRKLARLIPTYAPHFDDRDTAEAWASELSDLTPEELARACRKAVAKCDKFPSIARLKAYARPKPCPEANSRLVPELIWRAIESCGTPNAVRARSQMGELAWKVVEKAGGWDHICSSATYDAMTILKAQWRGLADAVQAHIEAGVPLVPGLPEAPSERRLKLQAVSSDELV